MKWSAFAAEFEEIDVNVEYVEKENEFDQVRPLILNLNKYLDSVVLALDLDLTHPKGK